MEYENRQVKAVKQLERDTKLKSMEDLKID